MTTIIKKNRSPDLMADELNDLMKRYGECPDLPNAAGFYVYNYCCGTCHRVVEGMSRDRTEYYRKICDSCISKIVLSQSTMNMEDVNCRDFDHLEKPCLFSASQRPRTLRCTCKKCNNYFDWLVSLNRSVPHFCLDCYKSIKKHYVEMADKFPEFYTYREVLWSELRCYDEEIETMNDRWGVNSPLQVQCKKCNSIWMITRYHQNVLVPAQCDSCRTHSDNTVACAKCLGCDCVLSYRINLSNSGYCTSCQVKKAKEKQSGDWGDFAVYVLFDVKSGEVICIPDYISTLPDSFGRYDTSKSESKFHKIREKLLRRFDCRFYCSLTWWRRLWWWTWDHFV